MAVYRKLNIEKFYCCFSAQPSPHFSRNEINAILLNGQHAVTAITALWLWRSTAFRWLQQPIGRYLMSDVVEQVIQRHPEVKNEGIPEARLAKLVRALSTTAGTSRSKSELPNKVNRIAETFERGPFCQAID